MPFLLKTIDELEKKVISLINTIKKAIDASISRAKLCLRSVLWLYKECKGAEIKTRKIKKIWKKEKKEESWEKFRLGWVKKDRVIAKVKKRAYRESRAEAYSSSEKP